MKVKPIIFCPNSQTNPLLSQTFLSYNFSKAAIRLKERLNEEIAAFGVSTIEFGVMFMIDQKKVLSQKELGAQMHIDKASIVKFLDRLQGEGYISRTEDKADRRIKILSLTSKGKKTLEKLLVISEKNEQAFLSEKLSAGEKKTLKQLMQRLMA